MRLWDFALDYYRRDGVAAACLALQDQGDVDVNVLIHAIWRAAIRGEAIAQGDVADADASVAAWRQSIVLPLRALRRRLKTGPPPAPGEVTEKLRGRIKAAELDAEHIELDTLEAMTPERSSSADASDARQSTRTAVLHVLEHFAPGRSASLSHAVEALVEAI
ncbi:TIGR02444 family protein [Shinella sp. S4-D37]|uniref:TIGR02444 family protein n=1 Tax=Shinella sp. S4-D37 TaxID=3161999 RepID=UPI0034668A98